jgi:hypothetical protein
MKRVVIIGLFFFVCCSVSFGISASDQAARDIALGWLATVDAAQYSKAWNAYPPRIKAGGLEKNFDGWMRARRYPLGHAKLDNS